jgi:hypothetical protein
MSNAEILVPCAEVQRGLGSADAQLVLFDHTKTRDIILYGDVHTCLEYFDPRLLEALRTKHQEFEAIYCEPHGGVDHGDCAGNQEREGY